MQTTHTLKALIIGAFITTSLGVMGPAYAISPQGDTVSVKIDMRDLETDRGIAKVYKSLERRAESACDSPGIRGLAERNAAKSCTAFLLNDFVSDVNHDGLTAYYNAVQAHTS